MNYIKFDNKENEAKGSFILSRTGPINCYPDGTYACESSQLREVKGEFAKEGITYAIVKKETASIK